MSYVVTRKCLGKKDRSCVLVCPVDCFYNIEDGSLNERFGSAANEKGELGMLMIHPDECIHCGACLSECPWEAIYEDTGLPAELVDDLKLNAETLAAKAPDELNTLRCTTK